MTLLAPQVPVPQAGLVALLHGRHPAGPNADRLSISTGSALPTWTSAITGGHDGTQPTTARQPTWQLEGWVTYDGTDDYHGLGPAGLLRNTPGATVYVLARCRGTAATQQGIYLALAGVSGTRFTLRRMTTGNLLVGGRRVDSDGFTSVDTGVDLRDVGWRLVGCTLRYAAGTYQAHINGESVGAQGAFATSGGNSADTDSASGHYVGAGGSGSDFLTGDIAMVAVYHEAHEDQQRRHVALAVRKAWGLT